MMKKIILGLALVSSVSVFANAFASPLGIYGKDDRKDYFEINDPLIKEIAKSTVSIIAKSELVRLPNGNFIKKNPETLLQQGMCPEEKFSTQVTYGHCSGSLIDKDLVLTAAHCFTKENGPLNFKNVYVIFNLILESTTQTQIEIKNENVFEIEEILYYDFYNQGSLIDLSVVRLNRSARQTPLKINRNFGYAVGAKIFMLGYPFGLPLKYTDDATILKIDTPSHSFHNDLDAFSGNSGSAIFDAKTNAIIGVLSRGKSENFISSIRGCHLWGTSKPHDTEEGMLLWDLPIY